MTHDEKKFMDDKFSELIANNASLVAEVKNLRITIEQLRVSLESNYVRKEAFITFKTLLFAYVTVNASIVGWIAKTVYDMKG